MVSLSLAARLGEALGGHYTSMKTHTTVFLIVVALFSFDDVHRFGPSQFWHRC